MLSVIRALAFAGLLVTSLSALAVPCSGFDDVDPLSPFCADVTWMKNRGITLGCAANQYCPNDVVTRLQMAAFMHRLGNVTFQQGGNAFGATAVLGTTDGQPVEIRARDRRVMRYSVNGNSPNLVGGAADNEVRSTSVGQTIAGGGLFGSTCYEGFTRTNSRICANFVDDHWGTVGGGLSNWAVGEASTVAGGTGNSATGIRSTVGGGLGSYATGAHATIAGGEINTAAGVLSMVPGGIDNHADGDYSFAAGRRAHALEHGMFVWADGNNFDFTPTSYRPVGQSANTFNVRATGVGGAWFVTGTNAAGFPSWGCYAQNGTGWTCTSDRNAKRNLEPMDGADVLEKVAAMPIYRWQPKEGPNADVVHVGPMAQDFHAAFGLGSDDKAIGLQDADGVALAAIQGLYQLAQQQARALEALRSELAEQRARNAAN